MAQEEMKSMVDGWFAKERRGAQVSHALLSTWTDSACVHVTEARRGVSLAAWQTPLGIPSRFSFWRRCSKQRPLPYDAGYSARLFFLFYICPITIRLDILANGRHPYVTTERARHSQGLRSSNRSDREPYHQKTKRGYWG